MLRILIAEDSEFQRQHLVKILAGYGSCDLAADGGQAMAMARSAFEANRFYDLIILDILMPGADGHHVLTEIAAIQANAGIPREDMAKVIMLSSLHDPDTILKAQFDEGADIFITKPYEPETILEGLANLGLIENPADGLVGE